MSNIAVIAAAGNGERLDCSCSKMLVNIKGKPLLSYTLDVFENSKKIDEIILVVHKKDIKNIEKEIIAKNQYNKINTIVLGGATRQESVYLGLQSIKENDGIVCIHDGARPLVEDWMIEKTIDAVNYYDGVIMAVPVIETIKVDDEISDGIAANPMNNEVYTANYRKGVLNIIDGINFNIKEKLELGRNIHGIDVSPDGKFLYVTSGDLQEGEEFNYIMIYDTKERKIVKEINSK